VNTSDSAPLKRAPEAAERWCRGILAALLRLEQHPEVSPLAPENAAFDFDLRQFLVRTKSRLANRALFTIVGNSGACVVDPPSGPASGDEARPRITDLGFMRQADAFAPLLSCILGQDAN